MTELGNILIGGIVTGAMYALLAVGFSIVFGVSGVLNLAQGAFVTAGALVMYDFISSAHMPVLLAFLASLAVLAVFMAIVEWLVIRPAVSRLSHTNLLMLMGGLLVAYQGAAFLIWGANPYTLSPYSGSRPLQAGGISVSTQDFWVLGAMVVSVGLLSLLLSRTWIGKALRATAENLNAARLMGIRTDRMILGSFVMAAMLGVVAGAVIAPLISLDFGTMTTYTNQGLIAVTLGGLGTVFGAMAGGLLVGVIEALATGYVSSLLGSALTLLAMIGVIVLRPQGLLGRTKGARADVATRPAGRVRAVPRLPRSWSRVGGLALVVFMIFAPLIIPAGAMRAVNITGIFALAVVGLDLLTGVAGQVSLGQAGFMAVGAYATAIFGVKYGWPPIAGLGIGLVMTAAVAALLGIVCTRLRGMYLAIVTLAFGILVPTLASDLSITGGPSGLAGVPVFSVAGYAFDTGTRFFYLIWGLVLLAVLGVGNLVRSNRGRILRAMHGDDTGARSLGLNSPRAKVAVFVISACMASVAGSLYADYFRYLAPDMVNSAESLSMITMVVIGGMGTVFGPLIGAGILTYVPLVFQPVAKYTPLIAGVLLIAFIRFLPTGIYGGLVELANRSRDRWRPQGERRPAQLLQAPASGSLASNGTGGSLGAGSARAEPAGDGPPALLVTGLSRAFGGVSAVEGVSFEVDQASICALIGPNGAGKSTVFNLVTNIYRPDAGQVELWGEPITGLAPDRLVFLGLLRTFQTSRIFPQLTVLENVLVGGYRMGRAGYLSQTLWLRKAREEERDLAERARRLLDFVGLEDRAGELADLLPLAAQKSLELARALMARPRLLLLDEPGAGMNDAETAELGAMLCAIRSAGHTLLVVEHNMSLVMGVADRVVVMDAGRVIAQGVPEKVQRDPRVVDAYFGRVEATA